jgi:DNA polymerase-3 subunit epsilon
VLVLNRRTATSRVVEPSTLGYASFLDVETTGFSPRADEIVELAIVLFEFNYADGTITEVVDSYSGLREPSVPIHPGASRVHGLTIDDLRGECLDAERVRALMAQTEFLIAHNASFDRPFVCRIFPEAEAKPWVCSCREIPWRRYGFGSARLQELTRARGIRAQQRHRALDDVMDAIELLRQTNSITGTTFFSELVRAGQADGRIAGGRGV